MIFLDSNVPMYLIGADDPHKLDAQRLLDSAVSRRTRLVTSAEVLQEILHRYHAIGRRDAIQPAFDLVFGLVDEVVPVDAGIVQRAKEVLLGSVSLSARDAVHVAAMQSVRADQIMSFDRGFDAVPGVHRVH